MKNWVIPLFIIIATPVFAEYRAFQYIVSPKTPDDGHRRAEVITSSLNPVAYRRYYGSHLDIEIVRTWMCMGVTGPNQPICNPPEMQASLQAQKVNP